MNRLLLSLVLGLPLAAACSSPPGGGGGDGGTMGAMDMKMATPPPPISVKSGAMMTDADESCLGSRKDPPGPNADTMITAKITDFQDDNIVVGATIMVWKDAADVPDPKKAIATSTVSDAMGMYTIKIPGGTPYRVIMGNTGGMAISNGNPVATIATYEFNRNFDDKARVAVKVSTREAIPGLVSVIPDPTLGVLAGAVRDCKNTEVGGATVKVSMTTAAYDSDALTFYFVKVGGSTLPTRQQHWTSPDNGSFAALNVPPGLATVTASGQVGSGTPKTLTTLTVPVLAGAITIAEMLPSTM